MAMVYLDNNATTQPLPEVREAIAQVLASSWANPSSPHAAGAASRRLLSKSRRQVAELIGSREDRLIFTSGGTEANGLVLFSAPLLQDGRRSIITSSVEHSSILHACDRLEQLGAKVLRLPVDGDGRVDPADLDRVLRRDSASLVSVQWANNETGVLQPVEDLARIACDHGVLFHTDAAQVVGKLPIEIDRSAIDFMTFTGHKLHGPAGVGAVWARQPSSLSPLVGSGTQERGIRPGTENLASIVGFGVAAAHRRERFEEVRALVGGLRDRFEARLLADIPGAKVNGTQRHRLWNCTNCCFPDADGQAVVAQLDALGVAASQTSACTTGIPEPSYVLTAMGLSPAEAFSSVRFSLSELNDEKEVLWASDQVIQVVARLRSILGSTRRAAG